MINVKKIKIKIIGLGIGDKAQGFVKISHNGILLVEDKTYNGEVVVCLRENEAYDLDIYSLQGNRHIYFYVDQKRECFVFCLFLLRKITYQLTDANYYNLPIEKGELLLWTK